MLLADKAKEASGVAFAALVQAMLNQGQHAVLRLVRTAREVSDCAGSRRAEFRLVKVLQGPACCAAPDAHGVGGDMQKQTCLLDK